MKSNTTPAGEVIREGNTATLLFRRQLAHPIESVWRAITDPAELKRWYMASSATVEGHTGGSVDMVTGPAQFHWTGKVMVWDPPRVFEYEFNVDPRPELPEGERTVVRWELASAGSGTSLTLTHRHLTQRTASGFAPGTHVLLDRLAGQLAGGSLPDWMSRYAEVQGLYPAWQRPA